VVEHRQDVSMVSPWLFAVDDAGAVVPAAELSPQDTADLARLRATGLPVVPTVSNGYRGAFRREAVARILHDPDRRRRHVDELVRLADDGGYDGIGIDYEELTSEDRDAFSRFVAELALALHGDGLLLAVDVFAKTTDAGYDERNRAQDLRAIGRSADQVRVMAYDLHWSTSEPGPVAPTSWVRDVVRYARSVVPRGRLVLGLPCYGYDWSGGVGRPVSFGDVGRLERTPGAVRRYDAVSGATRLRYTDAERVGHEVWFEDARSLAAKLDVARRGGVDGVFLWLYGPEDPGIWDHLRGLAGDPVPTWEG
jgi:spore germination protein YaaH